jgi:hypothetical protein
MVSRLCSGAETDMRTLTAHLEAKKGSEPAGFNIDGQKTDPDIIYSFDLYESFDIEFESSPSKFISCRQGKTFIYTDS